MGVNVAVCQGRTAVIALMLPAMLAIGCADTPSPTGIESALGVSDAQPGLSSTIADLLQMDAAPIAIAHRGMGANLGEDTSRPIENSVAAIREGFEAGVSVVELDLQMTADGGIVAWHDDFLDDYTCIATLTRQDLEQRAPHIASFEAVLQTAKRYNHRNADRLSGLLTVDLKPSSPLCDPMDTRERTFVQAVVSTIRRMDATELIYFNSMSPALLDIAREVAPEIPRQLTVLMLQMLSAEQVEAALGLPVKLIDRSPGYGLQWAEIGQVYRLPGYSSIQQPIQTAFAVGAAIISYDLLLLGHLEQQQPGAGAQLVASTQSLGLHVFGGDVSVAGQWHFGAALGVEALYADNVPLAVSLQPPLD